MIGTFTILNSYLNCEHAMYRRYIKRDGPKFVETPEMKWGNDVHSAFEYRIGARKPLPENMLQWESFASPFDGRGAMCELKMGITKDRKICEFWDKTGQCFFRIKIDLSLINGTQGYIADWKTGNSKFEDPFELEIAAMFLNARYPALTSVQGSYIWLKENRMGQLYDLSDFQGTWARVCNLMEEIESKQPHEFEKKKSGLCGYCAVSDCEHWRERK